MFFRKIILLTLSIYALVGIETVMAACYDSAAGEYCLTNKRYACPAGCWCESASKPDGALDKKGNKKDEIYEEDVAKWCSSGKACVWSAGYGQCGTSDAAKVFRCPDDFNLSDKGAKSMSDCYFKSLDTGKKIYWKDRNITCEPGTYVKAGYEKCYLCKQHHLCPGMSFFLKKVNSTWDPSYELNNIPILSRGRTEDSGIYKCPFGTQANEKDTLCVPKEVTCNAGKYLPANTIACIECKDGFYCSGGKFTFNTANDQGLNQCQKGYHVNDTKSACEKDSPTDITCDAGQYLPANAITCTMCKDGFYCSGGKFTFNSADNQGLRQCETGYHVNDTKSACEKNSPAEITCAAGQYLPANSGACVTCKDKYYACSGGKFSVNDFDQGITKCEDGYAQNEDKTDCINASNMEIYCGSGYFLPAYSVNCEPCSSSNQYCKGGTFNYATFDQGISTCPSSSVANSTHDSCVIKFSKDYLKYGPAGSRSPLNEQCWTKRKFEEYQECIFNENYQQHSNINVDTKAIIKNIKNVRDFPSDIIREKPVNLRKEITTINKDNFKKLLEESGK